MQTDAVSVRIKNAAHGYAVQLNPQSSQLVIDDWRLRNWITDAGAPAWAAPTTAYSIVSTAGQGDMVLKTVGAAITYDQAITYDYPTNYDGSGGTGGYWDLGYQDLGTNTPVTLPDGTTTDTPYISSIAINANKDLIAFYSNRFQNGYESGIWVMRVYDDGAGHIQWSEPTKVFATVAVDDFNAQSQLFVTFPRLQTINNEYWIVALECSLEVNVITYHLCYFRSADGIHWSDREYLAGVSNDTSEATVGINQHDSGTAFTLNDLKHGYLTVSGNKVYLSSKTGSKFSCAATSLVGVTNTNQQLDITADVPTWNLSLPSAPGAAQGTYSIMNQYQKYNGSAILIPGARLTHQVGYITANGNEVITVAKELVDEIKQSTQRDKNIIDVTTSDYTAWLRDWVSDIYWEYWSPQQATYDQFCDLTGINVINGRFFVGYGDTGTDLTAAAPDPNAPTDEEMGYINQHRSTDGSLEFQFKFAGSIPLAVTAAAVFQGVSDRQFYSIAYWVVSGKWVVAKATPNTKGNKIYSYGPVYYGPAQTLAADTLYWGKVTQWHNHIQFCTSTDRITWTTQIDYVAPPPPDSASITANFGYWGLLGHSVASISNALGNIDASGGSVAMYSGTSAVYYATKFTTGTSAGTVISLAGLFTQSNQAPDLTIGICTDNGGKPSDVTDYANILYITSMPSMSFSTSDFPAWRGVPVPAYVRVAANTSYWIFWTFNSALSGSQTWEWYTGSDSNATYTSTSGSTWSSTSYHGAACAYVQYDTGLTKFEQMYWTSAESPKTAEYVAKDIAAKASILSCTVDTFIADTDLVAGWQPSNFGTFGDFVMDADVSGAGAEIYFRATTNGDATTGFKIVMGSTITIYRNNVLIESIASLQPNLTSYHLTVSNQSKFIYIYVNECLAATCYNSNLTTPGYFGVGVATFTNLRIPDMTLIKPYTVIQANKSALSALQELTSTNRYKFFMRFDGTLRIGSFLRRTSQDTYQTTVIDATNVNTARYAVNELMPTGNYYAKHWAAYELDIVGKRRFKQESYTDVISNEDAYLAAANVLLRAREQAAQYQLNSVAVWPAEREDRITVTNPLDGVSTDYIMTTIDWTYELETGSANQKVGLRVFVS